MADHLFKDHKPSASQGEARLRGLWRSNYSKTISLSARIHTVEAVFVNGDILQDDVADNVFDLLPPRDNFPCELRAFAQDGHMLCQFGRWRHK
jgi:hypothetical protein